MLLTLPLAPTAGWTGSNRQDFGPHIPGPPCVLYIKAYIAVESREALSPGKGDKGPSVPNDAFAIRYRVL